MRRRAWSVLSDGMIICDGMKKGADEKFGTLTRAVNLRILFRHYRSSDTNNVQCAQLGFISDLIKGV